MTVPLFLLLLVAYFHALRYGFRLYALVDAPETFPSDVPCPWWLSVGLAAAAALAAAGTIAALFWLSGG